MVPVPFIQRGAVVKGWATPPPTSARADPGHTGVPSQLDPRGPPGFSCLARIDQVRVDGNLERVRHVQVAFWSDCGLAVEFQCHPAMRVVEVTVVEH